MQKRPMIPNRITDPFCAKGTTKSAKSGRELLDDSGLFAKQWDTMREPYQAITNLISDFHSKKCGA